MVIITISANHVGKNWSNTTSARNAAIKMSILLDFAKIVV